MVVVLYPNDNDGRPGNLVTDRSIRSTFASGSSESIEIHSEFLDVSRFQHASYQQHLAEFLRRKYEGRRVELVIAGLAPALDFALRYREEVFPGVPIVFCAIDEREVKAHKLPPDVIGVPIACDLAATLDLALGLHPGTRRVYVVAGKSRFDLYWEAVARETFRPYESRVEVVYLTGLPLPLGGNAIRRALGPTVMPAVTAALRESIQYALDHRDEALAYAMQFARDLDTASADKFVGMYVNERTLDYGPDGREAVRRLLDMGHKAGIIGPEAKVDCV